MKPTVYRTLSTLLVVVAVAVASGCDGGNDQPEPAPAPAPAPDPAPASSPPGSAASAPTTTPTTTEATQGAASKKPRVVFLGDSLTAGYGVERDEAFPVIVADLLRQDGLAIDAVNAGLSGDTTAGGLRRLDWLLK